MHTVVMEMRVFLKNATNLKHSPVYWICLIRFVSVSRLTSGTMASQETVNPRLIKSNIDLFTKVLKKPNFVTEKQLSRPPFRFLHELLTLIVKTTGYLRGLFSEEEFQLDQISTKEAKIAFLDKLIDAVGFINSKAVDVKSAKIVTGTEVEKTNRLLNELAKAVTDKKPFVEAVEKVRKGLKPPEGTTSNTSNTPTTKTSNVSSSVAKKTAPTKAAPSKPTPASNKAKAAPTKSQPVKNAKTTVETNKSKSTAPTKAAPTKTVVASTSNKQKPTTPAVVKSEPEPRSIAESVESSDKSLEPTTAAPTPKSEPESIEFPSTKKSREEPLQEQKNLSADESDEPMLITTGRKLSTDFESVSSVSNFNNQNNAQSIQDSFIVGTKSNNVPERFENFDNNIDQLVADLDDEEDEGNDQVLINQAPNNGIEQNFLPPDDSGIDSKLNSVSTNQSDPPENHQSDQPVSVEPEIYSPQIQPRNSARSSESDNQFRVASSTKQQPQPEPEPEQQQTTVVVDRKKSATIRSSRRPSKSGVAPQTPLGVSSDGPNALSNFRGGHNVPSSAAPFTFTNNVSATNGSLETKPEPSPPQQRSPPVIQPQTSEPPLAPMKSLRSARPPTTVRSARPSSSRPAPPRVMTASRSRLARVMETRTGEQSQATQPSPNSPMTPDSVWPPPEGLNLTINAEEDANGGDETDDYVMSSKTLQDSLLRMNSNDGGQSETVGGDQFASDKGRLVQQLMATKSELEGNVVGQRSLATANKSDESASADTKQLRTNVHLVCQSVGGLSKMLNYLHEDVDPMMSELQKWKEECRANQKEIDKIKANTEAELGPLRKELEAVELEVTEYNERLMKAKASVHRNTLSIAKLISSI